MSEALFWIIWLLMGVFIAACFNALYVYARWCGLSNEHFWKMLKKAVIETATGREAR